METSKYYRLFVNGESWCSVDINNKKHKEYINWLKETLSKYGLVREMYLVPTK